MKKTLLFLIIIGILLVVGYIAKAEVVEIKDPLDCGGKDKPCTISDIIQKITGLLKVLAIGVGTIMIIISGLQYMTSAGSEEKATKAKKTILYTIIGVAIVVAVDFIVGLIQEILGKTQ